MECTKICQTEVLVDTEGQVKANTSTMTGEEEQTIPVDPRMVDWTKTMQHEREVIWKNWATYQEDLVKARDEAIKQDNKKFGIFTTIANETEEELQHYKDMLFYLLHRPYKPKPKGNKRNTKNRGKDTCSCSVVWMFVLVNQHTGLTITVCHFSPCCPCQQNFP
jgi:hypothetical protein